MPRNTTIGKMWASSMLLLSMIMQTATAAGNLVTMDFQDVDLRQVVRFVAEVTGKNIVVDPRVKGQVSVITPEGVTLGEAYSMFETILTIHGFTVQEQGGVYSVIPAPDGKTVGDKVQTGFSQIPEGEGLTLRILRLQHADANALVALLRPLMHAWGLVVAHPPTNSLIVADTQSTTRKLLSIIKELDIPADQGIRKLIPLHHAMAAQVEKVVNGVYADFNAGLLKGSVQVKVFADLRTNTLIVISPKEHIKEVSQLVMELDRKSTPGNGNLHLYYPKHAKAEEIAKVLNDLLTKIQGGAEKNQPLQFLKQVSIVADSGRNTLVIAADKQDYELLMEVVRGLDMPRVQVFVEAIILEVTGGRQLDLGVDWRMAHNGKAWFGVNGNSFNPLTADGIAGAFANEGVSIGLLESLPTQAGPVVGLGAIINALEKDTDVNILSTPQILTLDNEKAEIIIGENIPMLDQVTTTDAGPDKKYKRQDVGLSLNVTPQILENGYLLLDIYQESSNVQTDANAEAGLEKTTKRSIKTKVMLRNRETVVLGGLISETSTQTVGMVPCIGGVSGVGELFKNTNRNHSKANLMVLIRPVVVDPYEGLLELTRGRYHELQEQWHDRTTRGTDLLPLNKTAPLQPIE